MILCHLFLLLQEADVCPMVFFGAAFAYGSRSVLRVCRLAIVPPQRSTGWAAPAWPSCPAAGARSSGAASWIFGRHFRPAAQPPAGKFWNRLGRGSFDHVCAWWRTREGVHDILC